MSTLIQCPKCRATLLENVFNLPGLVPCPTCATPLQVEVFPALFRKIAPGQKAEAVLVEGESSCFYHPLKKAVCPCDGCGRFLCALCDCELAGQHFCPNCLDVGKSKGKIQSLHNHRTRHESIALSLAILSVLLFFTIVIPPILALISMFIAIRHWKGQQSVVGGHRGQMVLAILVALGGIAAATAFFLGISAHN